MLTFSPDIYGLIGALGYVLQPYESRNRTEEPSHLPIIMQGSSPYDSERRLSWMDILIATGRVIARKGIIAVVRKGITVVAWKGITIAFGACVSIAAAAVSWVDIAVPVAGTLAGWMGIITTTFCTWVGITTLPVAALVGIATTITAWVGIAATTVATLVGMVTTVVTWAGFAAITGPIGVAITAAITGPFGVAIAVIGGGIIIVTLAIWAGIITVIGIIWAIIAWRRNSRLEDVQQ